MIESILEGIKDAFVETLSKWLSKIIPMPKIKKRKNPFYWKWLSREQRKDKFVKDARGVFK